MQLVNANMMNERFLSQASLSRAQNNVANCCQQLAQKGLTIAFAESATAGFLSFLFSLTNKSGDVLKGGIICYDACIKEDVLRVPSELMAQFSAESLEVSDAIAAGLASIISADIHVGITGLTKPGGSESPEKPVGTIFTVIRAKDWQVADRSIFTGTEQMIVEDTVSNLCMLIERKLAEIQSTYTG